MKPNKRIKEALKKINYSGLLSAYDLGDFIEVVVDRYGDIVTYRIYNDGDIVVK